MAYTDSNQPDVDVAARSQVARDKAGATKFDTEVLFSHRSTYRGSEQALARLAAIAGKPVETPELQRQHLESQRATDALIPED